MKYSKKIYVGKKYKIRLFSWSWFRFRYKIKSGQLYFNNMKLIKRLKLDADIVKEIFNESKIEETKNYLEDKINFLEKRVSKLININKNLISIVNDVNDINNSENVYSEDKNKNTYEINFLKKNLEEKVYELKKEQKNILMKYDSLLEIIADNIAENTSFPNILSSDFNMKSICEDKHSSNTEKILYSIYFLIKKNLADKGMSIR